VTAADVDVVIPVRNGGRLLRRAVDSVLAQQGVSVRVVIVDDGSTDGAPHRLPRDRRVRIVEGPARGIPQALNVGLAVCDAPYVARQDADDESLPGRLREQLEFLDRHCGIGLIATDFEVVVGDAVVSTTRTSPVRMLEKNPICAGSTVVRRTVLDETGGYRPVFTYSSDYDMWLRCAAVAGVAILPVIGYRYRLSADMTTVRNASRQSAYAQLARASARARIDGRPDPADDAGLLPRDRSADDDVTEWWAREFAALGARRDALACARRLPLRRAARLLPALMRRGHPQVVWP
jgi:glycosyltransferase involved in cell wall biosynthesis